MMAGTTRWLTRKVTTQRITIERKGENIRVNRRVEDDHISNQPQYISIHGFAKRSYNEIPVHPTPAQKEATSRKK
jgi:hypothetical protein